MINETMKNVEFEWKPKLRRNITTADILVLTISITIILVIRFSDILKGPLTNYEIRNIVLALLVLFTWIFFLWLKIGRIVEKGWDCRLLQSSSLTKLSIRLIILSLKVLRAQNRVLRRGPIFSSHILNPLLEALFIIRKPSLTNYIYDIKY